MAGFESYSWNGKPITDIKAFCKEHNTKMVRYIAKRDVLNPLTCRLEHEEYKGEMPQSFFENLRMTEGWNFCEIL